MGPKKVSAIDNFEKKKRLISMEQKHEITKKHERRVRVVDIAREYGRSEFLLIGVGFCELWKVLNPA